MVRVERRLRSFTKQMAHPSDDWLPRCLNGERNGGLPENLAKVLNP